MDTVEKKVKARALPIIIGVVVVIVAFFVVQQLLIAPNEPDNTTEVVQEKD